MEAKGEDIVHMEVGEPSFPTPSSVKKGAVQAIIDNRTLYTHSLGLPELRKKVAEYYLNTHQINIPPERVIITNGTSGALLLLFGALLQGGTHVVLSDPGYPCYKNMAIFVDAIVHQIPVSEDSYFEITTDHLKNLHASPDMLVLSTPSNPTGIIYRKKTLASLQQYLSSRGALLVVDEIYSGLSYDEKPSTALTISKDIVVVNGFSKTYAMTGFRLGWMVVPEDLIRPLQKCAQNLFISPPSVSQYAALFAFDSVEEIQNMRETYKKRRDYLVPRLRDLGFYVPVSPSGAFYVYAGIERWMLDSMYFVERALVDARVAITPGYDFGTFGGGSHVRFSYADDLQRLKIGCDRLQLWLKTL
jgi:aspartate/methionine/tyrosine aminotransferase